MALLLLLCISGVCCNCSWLLSHAALHYIWYECASQHGKTSLAAVQLRSEDLKVFVESLLGLCSQDQRQLAEVRQSEDSLRRELQASQAQLAGHPLQASLQSQSALTVRSVGPPFHLGCLRGPAASQQGRFHGFGFRQEEQAPSHTQTALSPSKQRSSVRQEEWQTVAVA